MKRLTMIAMTSVATLGLAACGEPEVAEEPLVEEELVADPVVEDIGTPVAGELTEEQQANLDALDVQATSDEYDTNYEAMQEEMAASAGAEGDAMSAEAGAGAGGIPPRSEMDFAFLDRNGDGELSVAEYAIWALPTNPTDPVPNDATAPYLTEDQINEAAQTFFFFDEDGSTYLSESEFEEARNSAMGV